MTIGTKIPQKSATTSVAAFLGYFLHKDSPCGIQWSPWATHCYLCVYGYHVGLYVDVSLSRSSPKRVPVVAISISILSWKFENKFVCIYVMVSARGTPVAPAGTAGTSRSLSEPLVPFPFILYLCALWAAAGALWNLWAAAGASRYRWYLFLSYAP